MCNSTIKRWLYSLKKRRLKFLYSTYFSEEGVEFVGSIIAGAHLFNGIAIIIVAYFGPAVDRLDINGVESLVKHSTSFQQVFQTFLITGFKSSCT